MVDEETIEELQVTFNPALYLQRRGWVFDQMRREGVSNVVDIGCGEGETIACLCNPAPWRGPLRLDCKDSSPQPVQDVLHIQSVHALDISASELRLAAEVTAPPVEESWITRWEPLDVKLWHGGLESFNPEFVDAECIISTEVIEHLPEDALAEFAPMLLGVYHPHLLLITTPSYDFNARFTAPDAPRAARRGFPDPTSRTDRIFRHHDHKFEWTVEEFTAWCQATAREWGYDVETAGVGRAQEKDEWGRDDKLGGASQVAAFRRRDGPGCAKMRAEKTTDALARAKARAAHQLVASHHHDVHESSGIPGSAEDISGLVKEKMQQWQDAVLTVHELWFDKNISILCEGELDLLISSLETDGAFSVSRNGERVLDWPVEYHGLVPDVPEQNTGPQDASEPVSDPESAGVGTPLDAWEGWEAASSRDTDVKWEEAGWAGVSQASEEASEEDSWGVQGWTGGVSATTAWG